MPKQNSRVYNMIQRNKSSSEKKMFNAYHRGLESIRKGVLTSVSSGNNNIPTVQTMTTRIIKEVLPAYKFVAKQGFSYGIIQVEQAIGEPITRFIAKASTEDLLDLGLPAVQRSVTDTGMKKVKTVATTYHDRLRNQMKLSIDAKESRAKLTTRIQNMTGVTRRQAQTIARTETTKVFNAGSLAGYEKSNITDGKEWQTNIMGNPRHPPESRFNHLGANGEKVALNKPFIRTGGSLMHPGDPSGAVGNVINCYCAMSPVINLRGLKRPVPKPDVPDVPLVEHMGETSLGFKNIVNNEYNKYSTKVKKVLKDGGIKIQTGNKITSILPELKGKHPRGWSRNTTWDNADGIFNTKTKSVIVTEYRMANKKLIKVSDDRVKMVFNHEMGHSFDLAKGNVSSTDKFIESFQKDKLALPARRSITEFREMGVYDYCIKNVNVKAGREEAFAISFQSIMERNTSDYNAVKKLFPTFLKEVENMIK